MRGRVPCVMQARGCLLMRLAHASVAAPTLGSGSLARAHSMVHGLSRFAQPMHDCQHAQPLNWTARAQDAHDGLRGRHAGLRRRHEVDIGFLRAGGWIEGLSLLSYMRGSSAAIRLVHLCMNANRMLAAVYAHTSASEHSHGNSDSS